MEGKRKPLRRLKKTVREIGIIAAGVGGHRGGAEEAAVVENFGGKRTA